MRLLCLSICLIVLLICSCDESGQVALRMYSNCDFVEYLKPSESKIFKLLQLFAEEKGNFTVYEFPLKPDEAPPAGVDQVLEIEIHDCGLIESEDFKGIADSANKRLEEGAEYIDHNPFIAGENQLISFGTSQFDTPLTKDQRKGLLRDHISKQSRKPMLFIKVSIVSVKDGKKSTVCNKEQWLEPFKPVSKDEQFKGLITRIEDILRAEVSYFKM
jgi:hypothetical protein